MHKQKQYLYDCIIVCGQYKTSINLVNWQFRIPKSTIPNMVFTEEKSIGEQPQVSITINLVNTVEKRTSSDEETFWTNQTVQPDIPSMRSCPSARSQSCRSARSSQTSSPGPWLSGSAPRSACPGGCTGQTWPPGGSGRPVTQEGTAGRWDGKLGNFAWYINQYQTRCDCVQLCPLRIIPGEPYWKPLVKPLV